MRGDFDPQEINDSWMEVMMVAVNSIDVCSGFVGSVFIRILLEAPKIG